MQTKAGNQVYAGFFVRLAAYLIDSVIVGAVLAVFIRFPIWISSLISPDNIVVRDLIFEYSIADIVVYVLSVIYFILLTYKSGATIGKKLLHIKVVSTEDRNMTLFEVIYRETVGRFLSALIVYAGYFVIMIHGEKRGLHDLLADTKVIYHHEKDVHVEVPIVQVGAQNPDGAYAPASYVPATQPEITVESEAAFEQEIVTDKDVSVEAEAPEDAGQFMGENEKIR